MPKSLQSYNQLYYNYKLTWERNLTESMVFTKKAMQGKPITKDNIIEAVKQITPYKWAKEKGFDKIELKTSMNEFNDLLGDINKLEELKVIYHK